MDMLQHHNKGYRLHVSVEITVVTALWRYLVLQLAWSIGPRLWMHCIKTVMILNTLDTHNTHECNIGRDWTVPTHYWHALRVSLQGWDCQDCWDTFMSTFCNPFRHNCCYTIHWWGYNCFVVHTVACSQLFWHYVTGNEVTTDLVTRLVFTTSA